MKFQGFAVRTIGDRKAAAAAVVDQQVDILAWQILEAVALRQFQCQAQHVMREPSLVCGAYRQLARTQIIDRKSTRLKLQSLMRISYAVFCLQKKKTSPNAIRNHKQYAAQRPNRHRGE